MFSAFFKHLFPRVVLKKNLKISYTFCLGGMAFAVFILLSITGCMLLFYYNPTPEGAYKSILYIEEHVFAGRLVRNIHKMSSNFFLILIFLHTLRVIFTGAMMLRRYNWIIGMLLLILAILAGYTGYLLPMDQLAYWATQTGIDILKIFPFGNFLIEEIIIPDGVAGKLTLSRFYALHIYVIPFLIFFLCMIHFYKVRKDKGVLPYL